MSGSVFKLKVETNEYDNKLKNAATGIQHLAKRAHDLQGSFTNLEKEEVEFIRNLGYMNTASKTAVGATRELENAYKGLATTYNSLSDAEKADEGGKALAESLDMLKQRTLEAKKNLDDATKSLNDNSQEGKSAGGILDKLASKFVVNVDAMKLFNMGLSAATGALDVVKDAFFNNEQNLDEWDRTVEASHSLYNGFLNALNTGNIGGYLSNIDKIVEAARRAYNALDELNTFNAFNQINVEKTRTGLTESIVDLREGSGTKEAVKAAGDAYKKELQERKRLEKDAYLEAVGQVAAERGVSKQDLLDALGGSYGHYQDLKNVQMTGERITYTSGGMFGGSIGVKTKYAQTREEQLGVALRHLNDAEIQNLQALGAQAERTGNEIAQVDKQITRVLNGRQPGAGGSGGGGGTRGGRTTTVNEVLPVGSVAELTKQMQELQKAQQLVTDTAGWKSYQDQIDAVKKSIDELKGITTVSDRFNTIMAAGGINPADLNRQSVSDIAFGGVNLSTNISKRPSMQSNRESMTDVLNKISDTMSGTASSVGNIFSGVEQMGIDIPNEIKSVLGVVQGVATILTGISSLVTIIAGTSWLPFANGGVVHAAGGVIVPGNHRSGDMVPAMLNSGEVVLNAAQAANLSSILQSGAGENLNLTATISGEQIRLALKNNSRRRGRGEYVTSNTIR